VDEEPRAVLPRISSPPLAPRSSSVGGEVHVVDDGAQNKLCMLCIISPAAVLYSISQQ
jgi:hypothetical protein